MSNAPASKSPDQTPCAKCNGTGHISSFRHVEGGECFDCGGFGVVDPEEQARKAAWRPAPRRAYDPGLELRNLYRAARSQGQDWANAVEDGDYDVAATVGYHMARVPADVATRALAAFRAILTDEGGERVARAFEAASVKAAA